MNKHIVLLFSFIFIFSSSQLIAQTGPASVGTSTDNQLWLDVSQLTGFSDGDDVATWTDFSGNTNNGTVNGATATSLTYRTGVINGYPVIRFRRNGVNTNHFDFGNFMPRATTEKSSAGYFNEPFGRFNCGKTKY